MLSNVEKAVIADLEFKYCLSLTCAELVDILLLRWEETNCFVKIPVDKKQDLIEALRADLIGRAR